MHDPRMPARHVKFGPFERDLRSSELRKGPTRLKVPDQSIEILKALVHQPGELVTRRLREALGDSADTPPEVAGWFAVRSPSEYHSLSRRSMDPVLPVRQLGQ